MSVWCTYGDAESLILSLFYPTLECCQYLCTILLTVGRVFLMFFCQFLELVEYFPCLKCNLILNMYFSWPLGCCILSFLANGTIIRGLFLPKAY